MNIERFAESAYKRHAIYIRKSVGLPKPWSDERVFQDYRFCNVFRRIDKTTEWIMNNVVTPLENDDHLWASIILARYVSRIDVLIDLYFEGAFDPKKDWNERRKIGANTLLNRRAHGLPINTAAFITSPMLGDMGPTKAHYINKLIVALDDSGFGEQLADGNKTMQNTWEFLRRFRCVGSFMAYQYCCDFSYIQRYLGRAPDLRSWSARGPGSTRGMLRLSKGRPEGGIRDSVWLENMRDLFSEWKDYIAKTLDERTDALVTEVMDQEPFVRNEMSRFNRILLQDVQHWLCEYDKYERGGSRKRSYDGR